MALGFAAWGLISAFAPTFRSPTTSDSVIIADGGGREGQGHEQRMTFAAAPFVATAALIGVLKIGRIWRGLDHV